uniref:Uncharacterized protein n=1 Tax=Anguilla anguilla TaxID=7936 RepID=A0A0E9UAI2_ANGAN
MTGLLLSDPWRYCVAVMEQLSSYFCWVHCML